MLIIKVFGGLGNQLFQLALYLSLKSMNLDVKLDFANVNELYNHANGNLLNYLQNNTEFTLATEEETKKLIDERIFFRLRRMIDRNIIRKQFLIKKSHYIEKNYSKVDYGFFEKNEAYLQGYWQNERYFKYNREKILKNFTWKIVNEKSSSILKEMQNNNSVSIHVRRYDKPRSVIEILYFIRLVFSRRVCSKKYYHKAIRSIGCCIDNPKFYVFTDDLAWVEKNLPLKKMNYIIVDWNRKEQSYQDIFLMSQCKYNIISMSSFSWWGAWLNNNAGKVIIAPEKWVFRFEHKSEIIPDEWIRI